MKIQFSAPTLVVNFATIAKPPTVISNQRQTRMDSTNLKQTFYPRFANPHFSTLKFCINFLQDIKQFGKQNFKQLKFSSRKTLVAQT
jgi:hypothetical protein